MWPCQALCEQAGLPNRVPLTRSRCITWSIVLLPYLVAFGMGYERKSGGISTGPQRTAPGTEAAAGAWVKVWSPRCSPGHLCHLQM